MNVPTKLHLRPATIDDAKLLFAWRNDKETKENSLHAEEISWENHLAWFNEWLNGNIPTRIIYIAEHESQAIGVIRADKNSEGLELSWTIAPEARGHRYGKAIVLQFVQEFFPNEQLIVTVEDSNIASRKIAEALGLHPAESISLEDDRRSFTVWR